MSSEKQPSLIVKDPRNNLILDIKQLISYLPSSQWYFYKNIHSIYQGCNATFSKIVGAGEPRNIMGMRVSDLKYLNNKILAENAKQFEEIDHKVFDCAEGYELRKQIYFEKAPFTYEMNCNVFPILNESEQVAGLFGIGCGQMIISSEIQNIFRLVNKFLIGYLLKKPRYLIQSKQVNIFLTRRAVACLLYLMKGRTAKELSNDMSVTARTAENYIAILKEKFGCNTKSQLISCAFESTLITELLKNEMKEADFIIEKIQTVNYLYHDGKRIFIKT